MSTALEVAKAHALLVTRKGSPVFHVASCGDLTPSGRWLRRDSRVACNARTRRLSVIPRIGVTVDLGGRRMCARCSARLSALARRAEQPPNNIDQRRAFFEAEAITSTDLVHALAVATTVEETHAIATLTNLLHGLVDTTATRRPATPGVAQGRWDFEVELLRRRRDLAAAARTPEEVEAAARLRETEAARDAQIVASRKRAVQVDRALDRRARGQYLMPHERVLADSA